jgi:hypothetical protein
MEEKATVIIETMASMIEGEGITVVVEETYLSKASPGHLQFYNEVSSEFLLLDSPDDLFIQKQFFREVVFALTEIQE